MQTTNTKKCYFEKKPTFSSKNEQNIKYHIIFFFLYNPLQMITNAYSEPRQTS